MVDETRTWPTWKLCGITPKDRKTDTMTPNTMALSAGPGRLLLEHSTHLNHVDTPFCDYRVLDSGDLGLVDNGAWVRLYRDNAVLIAPNVLVALISDVQAYVKRP
jgi:hypothetical protein